MLPLILLLLCCCINQRKTQTVTSLELDGAIEHSLRGRRRHCTVRNRRGWEWRHRRWRWEWNLFLSFKEQLNRSYKIFENQILQYSPIQWTEKVEKKKGAEEADRKKNHMARFLCNYPILSRVFSEFIVNFLHQGTNRLIHSISSIY